MHDTGRVESAMEISFYRASIFQKVNIFDLWSSHDSVENDDNINKLPEVSSNEIHKRGGFD